MKSNPHVKTWYGMIATFATAGMYTKMPGTVGTFVAFILLLSFGGIPLWVLALTVLAGTAAADRYAKNTGREDPGEVVVDEVAGYWVSMIGLDPTFAIVAFFMFRVIDIIKPFPVGKMEKLPGGIGIMADDICGGAIVNVLLRLLHWLFFGDGVSYISKLLGIGA